MKCSKDKLTNAPPGLFTALTVLWFVHAAAVPAGAALSSHVRIDAPAELDVSADPFPAGHSGNRIDSTEGVLEDQGNADYSTPARAGAGAWLTVFHPLAGTARRHSWAVLPRISHSSRLYLITERFRL